MGVIQEWHWLCDVAGCMDASEEAAYSEDVAQAELDAHLLEVHGIQRK